MATKERVQKYLEEKVNLQIESLEKQLSVLVGLGDNEKEVKLVYLNLSLLALQKLIIKVKNAN